MTLSNRIIADDTVVLVISWLPSDGVPITTPIPGTVIVFCSALFMVVLQVAVQGVPQRLAVVPLEIRSRQKVETDIPPDGETPNFE